LSRSPALALQVHALIKRHPAAPGSAPVEIRLDALELAPGAQLALRGPSGCGKTTLLHLIAGILRPDAGEIHLAGELLPPADERTRDRLRARHLGYVFQTFNLLQGFSIRENLQLAQRFAGQTTPADDAHREHLLADLGLAPCAGRRPAQLSHGQQQRVALARALVNRPALVLADEPTASLDDAHAAAVLSLLREACVTHGAALLLATHDERALRAFPTVRDLPSLRPAA
jgi:ABC-type lipoprotein export system ATPase subunit